MQMSVIETVVARERLCRRGAVVAVVRSRGVLGSDNGPRRDADRKIIYYIRFRNAIPGSFVKIISILIKKYFIFFYSIENISCIITRIRRRKP